MPDEHLALAVDRQEADEASLLHDLRRFLDYRRDHPAFLQGALQPLDLPAPLIGFVRHDATERVLCLFNMSDVEAMVPFLSGAPDRLAPYGTAFVAQAVWAMAEAAD